MLKLVCGLSVFCLILWVLWWCFICCFWDLSIVSWIWSFWGIWLGSCLFCILMCLWVGRVSVSNRCIWGLIYLWNFICIFFGGLRIWCCFWWMGLLCGCLRIWKDKCWGLSIWRIRWWWCMWVFGMVVSGLFREGGWRLIMIWFFLWCIMIILGWMGVWWIWMM